MTVVLLDAEHPSQADQRLVVGEDPDDVGASADLLVEALKRVGGAQLAPVRRREGVEGQDVGLGVLEQRGDLRHAPLQMRDGLGEPIACLVDVLGVEDRADQRTEQPVLVLAGVPEAVSEEVHGAALPAAAQDLGDRGLQPGVRVADGQLHAGQPSLDQPAQELGPEGLGLGLADVDAEDLPAA
jgi:hypothetical protein